MEQGRENLEDGNGKLDDLLHDCFFSLVPCDVFGICSARNVLLGICEMEVRMMRESGFWEKSSS